MPDSFKPALKNRLPLKVAGIYLGVSLGWIFFSDRFLEMLLPDPALQQIVQTWKGSLFVLASSALIFLLVRHSLNELQAKERVYRKTVEKVSNVVGEECFYRLAEEAARLTGVSHVLIGTPEADQEAVRTVAAVGRGQRLINFRYPLAVAPCAEVLKDGFCVYESKLQQLFPRDIELKKLEAESYMGIRIQHHDSSPLGLFILIDDQPMEEVEQKKTALQLLSIRAAAELERMETEATLAKSRDRLTTIIQGSLQGIIVHRGWTPLYVNQSALDIFGFRDPAQIRDFKNYQKLIAPEDRQRLRSNYQKRIRGGDAPERYGFKGVRTDGREIFLESRNILIDWEDGPAILSSLYDVTSHVQLEESLRLSEERFRALFDTISDGLFLHDLKGRIRTVNHRAAKHLGYTREALQQLRIDDIALNPDNRNRSELWASVTEDSITTVNGIHQRKTGETFPVEIAMSAVHLNGEKMILASARDISRRLETEETLKRSELRYRRLSQEFQALLNGIPESINLLNSELDVVWANRSSLRTHHKATDQIFGRRCFELLYNRTEPCRDCPALRCFRTGERVETERRDHHGQIWAMRYFPVHDEVGKVVNVIEVAADITEARRLKQEALRNSQLAALGELAAGVAHEVNNPINGIINLAQLLEEELEDTDQQDVAHRIMKEGDRIAGIVRRLLTFARDEKQEKHPVKLQQILQDSTPLIQAQLNRDAISLETALAPDLPPVWGQAQHLQQVLLNLISNARYALNEKYPDGDERKRIRIEGQFLPDPGRIFLSIRDEGTGIEEESLERIFDPFYTTKPAHMGTGLGLSISHGIVRDHGGELRVKSKPGEFTEMILILPAQGECKEALPA